MYSLQKMTPMIWLIAWIALRWMPAAAPVALMKVDQAGYLTDAPNLAMNASADSPSANSVSRFAVRRAADDRVVFEGTLGAAADDADSGDRVRAADFSRVKETGTFYVDVPGVGRSWPFAIGPQV